MPLRNLLGSQGGSYQDYFDGEDQFANTAIVPPRVRRPVVARDDDLICKGQTPRHKYDQFDAYGQVVHKSSRVVISSRGTTRQKVYVGV